MLFIMKLVEITLYLLLISLEKASEGSSEIVRIALYAREKATVKCGIHNFVQWRYMPASNIIVEGNTLVFKPAFVYNGGAYICQGYKENSTELHNVTFHIYVGVKFENSVQPNLLYKKVGQQARFSCLSSRKPQWLFNFNKRLPFGIKLFNRGTVLIINPIQQFHEGLYVCYGYDGYISQPVISYGNLSINSIFLPQYIAFDYFHYDYGVMDPSQVTYVKDNIVIRCKSKSKPWWSKSGTNLSELHHEESHNNMSDRHSYSLHLFNVSSIYEGTYYCFGINNHNRQFIASSQLFVGERSNRIEPPIGKVKLGNNISFSCDSDSQVTWFYSRDGVPPYNKQVVHTVYFVNNLTLNSVSLQHDGSYFCYGYNKTTREQLVSKVELHVFDPNQVSRTQVHALEGENIRLSCYATISVWSLDGNALPYNALVSRDQVLIIKFANLHNQGYYECIGRNYNGQFFRSRVFLHVYVRQENMIYPKGQIVFVGDALDIYCKQNGGVRWIFETKNHAIETFSVFDNPSASNLHIPAVSQGNQGNVLCLGRTAGSLTHGERAIVILVDQNDTAYARVWISPTHAKRPVHSTIRFLCEVDYNGDYRIEWTFYGQRIPANSRIIDEIELEITDMNLANSGKYTCLAKTDLGWSMVSSHLEVMSLDYQRSVSTMNGVTFSLLIFIVAI